MKVSRCPVCEGTCTACEPNRDPGWWRGSCAGCSAVWYVHADGRTVWAPEAKAAVARLARLEKRRRKNLSDLLGRDFGVPFE